MRIDKKGRISISTEELCDLNAQGNVRILKVPYDPNNPLKHGIAMKSLELKLNNGIIRIDDLGMEILKVKEGDKLKLQSMMTNKELSVVVGERLLSSPEELVVGMNRSIIEQLEIYKEGYVLLKKES